MLFQKPPKGDYYEDVYYYGGTGGKCTGVSVSNSRREQIELAPINSRGMAAARFAINIPKRDVPALIKEMQEAAGVKDLLRLVLKSDAISDRLPALLGQNKELDKVLERIIREKARRKR